MERVNRETNIGMSEDVLTLGFARRATGYKRADLLFHDLQRLESIAGKSGKFQILYAGKAHPNDEAGKQLIQQFSEQPKRCGHRSKSLISPITIGDWVS